MYFWSIIIAGFNRLPVVPLVKVCPKSTSLSEFCVVYVFMIILADLFLLVRRPLPKEGVLLLFYGWLFVSSVGVLMGRQPEK